MLNLLLIALVVVLNSLLMSQALRGLEMPLARGLMKLRKTPVVGRIATRIEVFRAGIEQGTGLQTSYDVADFADFMIICLGAGHTIPGAFAEAASSLSQSTLAGDAQRTLRYYNMGCSFGESVEQARRVSKSEAFCNLADTLVIALKMGSDLSSALELMCQNLRKNASCRVEENAARAPVKMLFPVVCFIFPAIFILLGAPVIRDIIDALR